MNKWITRVKLTNPDSAAAMLPSIEAAEANVVFLCAWEWQLKDNGAPSDEAEVTLTVKDLRRVCAFWARMGTGIFRRKPMGGDDEEYDVRRIEIPMADP